MEKKGNYRMKNKVKRLIYPVYSYIRGDFKWKSEKEKRRIFLTKYNELLNSQEINTHGKYTDFYQKILSGKISKINLIGDSITAGVGSPSYYQSKKEQIIFDSGKGEIYLEATHTIQSWANYFRYFIKQVQPNLAFVNSGIGGKSAKWTNENKEHFKFNKTDAVFVMLGTNDRWDCSTSEEYQKNLEQLLDYVNERVGFMYVMSPPPALTDSMFNFGIKEINDVVKNVCLTNNYNFISHYENLVGYAKNQKLELSQLLQTEGSHPIQTGYDQMWIFLSNQLGLTTK